MKIFFLAFILVQSKSTVIVQVENKVNILFCGVKFSCKIGWLIIVALQILEHLRQFWLSRDIYVEACLADAS